MSLREPFVLPPDVAVVPVADLAPALRAQLGAAPGAHVVTRPRSRTPSIVLDTQAAALLELFRSPTTLVDALVTFSDDRGRDPRQTLDEAFGALSQLISGNVLVAAASESARAISATLLPAARLGCFEVVGCVDVLLDTEVHLGRASDGHFVALKVARTQGAMGELLAREAAVLSRLDGRVNPLAQDLGNEDGRPFLALSWCPGVDALQAAADARALGETHGRRALLALAEGVISAYGHLHAQGVFHGDVHPRNLLVDADERVRIIDYGLAVAPGVPPGRRGGVDLYIEPEFAAARLARREPPALSAMGEQYSVAALVYVLLTGAHTHAFSLEQERMLQQIRDESPLPFTSHGVRGMPMVERTLFRALAKDADARFTSVAGLLGTLRDAIGHDERHAPTAARRHWATNDPGLLVERVLERLAVEGPLLARDLDPPIAPIMGGAAGYAYALLRMAGVRGDEHLLAAADLWASWAIDSIDTRDAFRDPEGGVVAERSLYHGTPGVLCVQALVARGRGDDTTQQAATDRFVAAAGSPAAEADVKFGSAGLLLGASLLLEALPPWLERDGLRRLGDALSDRLGGHVVDVDAHADSLGIAHGVAGRFYAVLRWSEASSSPPMAELEESLVQLAALAEPAGRGLCWPLGPGGLAPQQPLSASWCNGTAGLVHLWIAAHGWYREDAFEQLARRSAWQTYHAPAGHGGLCCGLAGRAYALLCLYKHTGDRSWLLRARRLTERATTSMRTIRESRECLYEGALGVAVLATDLQDPQHACMPLFEAEGWPRY